MLKDITLGQYFPGDTPAHKLDPRTKIILVILYIVALFQAKNLLTYALVAVTFVTCARVSKVGARALLKGLKPVVIIVLFTGFLNLFFTPGETLYAIELGEADASAAVEALLGEAAEADSSSTRYEILYSADSGSVSFSRSGALHAELSAAVGGRSYEQDMQRRLRGMGYTVWQTQPAVRQADGVYALGVEQALLGMPVFGGTLTFTYQDGALRAADGVFYPESGSIARVSEEACISCADALTQILASRDALGWVGSQITGMQQGYLHSETATSALRFTPVWRVETDTAVFYVNGITREVRQAE